MERRHEDFLITTHASGTSRRVVWHTEKPMPIDHPEGWHIERTDEGFRLLDESEENKWSSAINVSIDEQKSYQINLPPCTAGSLRRPLRVEIEILEPIPAAYLPIQIDLSSLLADKPVQLYMFQGLRYFLVRYRPVGGNYRAHLGRTDIFRVQRSLYGFMVTAVQNKIDIKFPDKQRIQLTHGQAVEMKIDDFLSATFLYGVHWWCFNAVPTPDALPAVETSQTEEDQQEVSRFHKSIQAFLWFFCIISLTLISASILSPPTKKVTKSDVVIKQPKIIPLTKLPETEIPKPPPPPPPKVVKVEKPKPVELEKPKPKPIELDKPKPKPVAQKQPPKPAPKLAMNPPPAAIKKSNTVNLPPAPKSNLPPAPGLITKQAQVAPPRPDPGAQLSKTLSFLSPSKNRTIGGVPADYSVTKQQANKNYSNVAVGGGSGKSNILNSISVAASNTNTKIDTKSSRTIGSSNVDFGNSGDAKGLNHVQGKVSFGQLYGSTDSLGDSLGGGGMSITGPGSLSESEIEKALSKHMAKFQYCYEKALLTSPSLGGEVTITWDISAGGQASKAKVIKSKINNAEMHNCVSKVILAITFPKPQNGYVTVKKVFSFTSSTL